MVEWGGHVDTTSIYLLGGALMAFSRNIKREVRRRQDNCCAECGTQVPKLEVHHKIPAALGGEDTIENAVGLCSIEYNGCHQKADTLAFSQGVIFQDNHGEETIHNAG